VELYYGPLFELRKVCFTYPDGSRGIASCSVSIQEGSRTALLGANGSGKTTLFLHLNGILRPQSGVAFCTGIPLDYSRQGLQALRFRIGLVFQNPDSQLFSASVREDVSCGPLNKGLNKQTVRERVMIDSARTAERRAPARAFRWAGNPLL
jgi:cobalt/nickel transport system ATP-binding protein